MQDEEQLVLAILERSVRNDKRGKLVTMPNHQFVAIWLVLFVIPFFPLVILPAVSSFGMDLDLDQKMTDEYEFVNTYGLEVPISRNMQWSVLFTVKGFTHRYRLKPMMHSFSN